MGNTNGGETRSRPPDKACSNKSAENRSYDKPQVLCNQPYLRDLFKRLAKKSAEKSQELSEDQPDCVTQNVFEDAFNGPLKILGRLLFRHITRVSSRGVESVIYFEEFMNVATRILSLISDIQQLNYYLDVFCDGRDFMTLENMYHMIQVCFAVSEAAAYVPFNQSPRDDGLLRALVLSIMGPHEKINKPDFVVWCSKRIPHIFNGTHSFMMIKLSGATFDNTEWHRRMSQEDSHDDSAFSQSSVTLLSTLDEDRTSLNYCILWLLTVSLPNLFVLEQRKISSKASIVPNFLMSRMQSLIEKRPWCLLYNSDEHGLSINRFEHHVFSYKGPTIMLISFENNLYALASDWEWRESGAYYGGENTVLIQLLPHFSIADRGKIVFLNHHARGVFKGVLVGSDRKAPILKIAEMNTVIHRGVELELQAIEVWGCASSEIRSFQLKQKIWERKEVEKLHNRKLKLENWEDNPDRMLLNWVGISTNHQKQAM